MKRFDALITTQKKLSSLQGLILEKYKEKPPKMTIFQKRNFFSHFLQIFSKM